eukprot:2305256-Pyramimonas_sp.AAC.1
MWLIYCVEVVLRALQMAALAGPRVGSPTLEALDLQKRRALEICEGPWDRGDQGRCDGWQLSGPALNYATQPKNDARRDAMDARVDHFDPPPGYQGRLQPRKGFPAARGPAATDKTRRAASSSGALTRPRSAK